MEPFNPVLLIEGGPPKPLIEWSIWEWVWCGEKMKGERRESGLRKKYLGRVKMGGETVG